MADSSVRAVTTNQTDIYKNLEQVVRKYAATRFLRPVADHTREAFESAKEFVRKFYASENSAQQDPQATPRGDAGAPTGSATLIASASASSPSNAEGSLPASYCVILDSGCGTGESTLHLARKFPGVPVIGIDKSAMRLNKAGNIHQLRHATSPWREERPIGSKNGVQQNQGENSAEPASSALGAPPANAFWVRAELLDFWKLALEEVQAGRWQVLHHAVYYPNPWPKESEATRRFHLHPIFPTLMALSSTTELRTNWEIYAREFAEAARILQSETTGAEPNLNNADATTRGKIKPAISCEPFAPLHPETAFERKYKEARQQLWRVLIKF
ncbi:MAG: methyltransferase domain-containing protein [Fibrobacter sp.]|nr:methyltransferase domain-containing protein [Fibrobacter sp.]